MTNHTPIDPDVSLPVLLRQRAEADPERILIEDVTGGFVTTAAFHQRAMAIADGLASLGVSPGDCIVTMLDPSIRAQSVWLGIAWSGAMEVPVNPDFRGNSLIYAVSDCKARILITSSAHLETLAAVRAQLPFVEMVLTIDRADQSSSLDHIELAEIEVNSRPVSHAEPSLLDPYAVIYTSGTTGPSKGVVTPWGSLQFALLNQLFKGDDPALYDNPGFYSPWPCFHSSGRTGLVFAGHYKGRVVIREKLSTSALWGDIRAHGCTHTHLLGIAGWLMQQPPREDDTDNPLKRVLMNPVLEDFADFERRFGVRVSTGWGMTEIGFPMAATDLTDYRTCGRLSPAYDARIVDESGADLPDGEAGELIIRGKRPWLLFTEYLGKPDATRASWKEGWYHTGDVLRREASGDYFFVDRRSDYMRVRGNNVSSVELESEIRVHPDIADVAAVAIPASALKEAGKDRGSGEDEICLFICGAAGAVIDPAGLITWMEPLLPRYMVPRFFSLVDDFPRTPTGKVQKKELRSAVRIADLWDRHDALTAPRTDAETSC